MPVPDDYLERVYAGVLGKMIGVYLGRPFEGWSHQRIIAELGEIHYYVNDKLNQPLIVSDDDITGTFTFVRALADYGNRADITAQQIGQTWLNYIIENKTILWWGGMGMSTEHTAYLRLKSGIPAPRSGSAALNSKVVSEQIGSQIFVDGWAMVAPGNPQLAVDLAKKAASVSHDGEAIHGAVVIAAIESLAFVEKDLNKLLDAAVKFIPQNSIIYQLIADLRLCRLNEADWHTGLALIHQKYSYEKFGGNCHIIPNHAVVMLGLLWGDDNFQRSLMITNTAGYDTDCNSANVGCLLGIKNGLIGIDAGPDYRGPVADRLLLPTADGGRCISDAVIETYQLAQMGMTLAGQTLLSPKDGARFHFSLPGSVQGFVAESSDVLKVENVNQRLRLKFSNLTADRSARTSTQTFMSQAQSKMGGYAVLASPTLYPGQTVIAAIAGEQSVSCALYLQHYDENDQLVRVMGPSIGVTPQTQTLSWKIPATDGQPIAEIGLEISSQTVGDGSVDLHWLTWSGTPHVELKKPKLGGSMWMNAWVDATQQRLPWLQDTLIQNTGRGLLMQGTRQWMDYRVSTQITPHMVKAAGLAARVQGIQRYYALLLCNDATIKLVKMLNGEQILDQKPFSWELTQTYQLTLEVQGSRVTAEVNGRIVFQITDADFPLLCGAIAIVCEEGRGSHGAVTIEPI